MTSGGLGLKSLITLHKNTNIKLSCVFTDNNSINIIDYCLKHNLKLFKGNPRKNASLEFIKEIGQIDLLFSINYLFIIEKELIEYPKLFALNIHGSLLPKYRGRTPHVWAIINGEIKTGITVHRIDDGVDTGDILLQKEIEINNTETGADILEKFNAEYPYLINESLSVILKNKFQFTRQNNSEATYYGKRTPNDGEINWNWSKERIYNWVRAQANPYPGSFSFYNNDKLVINKVRYSSFVHSFEIKNGTILSENPLLVKTQNGVIEIMEYYFENKEDVLKINKTLG